MDDNKKLWNNVLAEVELEVSKGNFSMWFKDTSILKQEDGVVLLSVPNVFVKDWLLNKYHKLILKSLRGFGENIRNVEYLITKNEPKKIEVEKISDNSSSSLPLNEHFVNKNDNLNSKYIFDTFVVGPFNELAYAAAQAIMKKPAVYNPLFFYGGTGHGKTHLIQALGNYFKTNFSDKKTFYLTSEKFVVDLMNALNSGTANTFKEKYRKYDTLIVDDIQFIAGKDKSMEEFFHLFNNFYENNKQIIFSSDKHPNFIPGLEDRIKSRFNSGMIIEIPMPDKESRIQIFRKKSEIIGLKLDPEIIEFLADNVEGNIREIEGVINTIKCHTELKGKILTIIDIKNLVKNTSKPKKNIQVKDVIKIISDFYNIEEKSIYDKNRKKELVKPRQIIMYILREDFDISFPSIGEKLGGRDHTTVMHSCDKIREGLLNDTILNNEIQQIRSMLK
ncbi:MAG: chromosomal replication initiator protein DnaA [Minisyncoccia bacterium]